MKNERELRIIVSGGGFWATVAGIPLGAFGDLVDPMSATLEWAAASIPFGTVVSFVLLSVCFDGQVFGRILENGDRARHCPAQRNVRWGE